MSLHKMRKNASRQYTEMLNRFFSSMPGSDKETIHPNIQSLMLVGGDTSWVEYKNLTTFFRSSPVLSLSIHNCCSVNIRGKISVFLFRNLLATSLIPFWTWWWYLTLYIPVAKKFPEVHYYLLYNRRNSFHMF